MKKRVWNLVVGLIALILIVALIPVFYIEAACRSPLPGYTPRVHYRHVVSGAERRAEGQSWLGWPRWHTIQSAQSLGRHLAHAPPSDYPYWQDVKHFWSGYCQVNRVTADMGGAVDSKLGIYTKGFAFSAQMLAKGLYENTGGRLFEWIGGWRSQDDVQSAVLQHRYAAFRQDKAWHQYPYGAAIGSLWSTSGKGHFFRHWERRMALTSGYGVEAAFAKVARLAGADGPRAPGTMRLVARGGAGRIASLDPRVRVVRGAPGGLVVVEVPDGEAFSPVIERLIAAGIPIVEIAGNDDIFLTVLMPRQLDTAEGVVLMSQPVGDGRNLLREGVSTKVVRLGPLVRAVRAAGGSVERLHPF